MNYLVSVIRPNPLLIHFSFYNPGDSGADFFAPRLLKPNGYFIRIKISNENGDRVFKTFTPKAKPKLHPDRQESYLTLGPGYTFGAIIELEEFDPLPGAYRLTLSYSNKEFRGYTGQPLGKLEYKTKLSFAVVD